MNKPGPTHILSFTLLVLMLGYGMVLPVMPFYIEKLGAGGTEMGWLMASYSLMQLICAPLWGILSDRIGRKPVLVVGVLGYAISLFFFGLATAFWMLFLARMLSGILSSAAMPTAMAYIGDHAPKGERSGLMGQLGAAMGVGIVVGPMLGGLLSAGSLSRPFFVGAGLAFLAFLLVILILPESHADQQSGGSKSKPSGEVIRQTLMSPAGVLLSLVFIMSFGLSNFQGIVGLYAVDKFSFSTQQVGGIWMVMGSVLIIAQGTLTGPLTKKFGELPLICAGLAGGILGYLGMSLAVDFPTTLLALSIFTLAIALIGPALNAYLSRFAEGYQGTVMGMNSAANSLGRITGPLWAGAIYDINIEYPFMSGAIVLAIDLVITLMMWKSLTTVNTTN